MCPGPHSTRKVTTSEVPPSRFAPYHLCFQHPLALLEPPNTFMAPLPPCRHPLLHPEKTAQSIISTNAVNPTPLDPLHQEKLWALGRLHIYPPLHKGGSETLDELAMLPTGAFSPSSLPRPHRTLQVLALSLKWLCDLGWAVRVTRINMHQTLSTGLGMSSAPRRR